MAYEIKLQQFEGPLDLLLHLIEQAKVDIKDIAISDITAQYMGYMSSVDELDMETASEFLTMAATLVFIKSRSLLPKPPREEDDPEDVETMLIEQLREYKAIKEASGYLSELRSESEGAFTRLPEEFPLPPQEYELDAATAAELFEAFIEVMHRGTKENAAIEEMQQVNADEFTVRDKISSIREILGARTRVCFEELFDENATKLERIVTFMALLEMIARHEVILKQSRPYARITITAGRLGDAGEDDEKYMDED